MRQERCKLDKNHVCKRHDRADYQGTRLLYYQGKCFDCRKRVDECLERVKDMSYWLNEEVKE